MTAARKSARGPNTRLGGARRARPPGSAKGLFLFTPRCSADCREHRQAAGAFTSMSYSSRRQLARVLPACALLRPAVRKKSRSLRKKVLTLSHELTCIFGTRLHRFGEPLLVGRESINGRTGSSQLLGQFDAKFDVCRRAGHNCSVHYFDCFGKLVLNLADLIVCFSELLLNSLRNFVQLSLVIHPSVFLLVACSRKEPAAHPQCATR